MIAPILGANSNDASRFVSCTHASDEASSRWSDSRVLVCLGGHKVFLSSHISSSVRMTRMMMIVGASMLTVHVCLGGERGGDLGMRLHINAVHVDTQLYLQSVDWSYEMLFQ